MPDLGFAAEGARADASAAVPTVQIDLALVSDVPVRGAYLACQIWLEPMRRRYSREEEARLVDLFGDPTRWSETQHRLILAQPVLLAPAFDVETRLAVPLVVSGDLELAGAKYLFALDDGMVPLALRFSGNVLYEDLEGRVQVAPVPHTKECSLRLPVELCRQALHAHHGERSFVPLSDAVFRRLWAHRSARGHASWDAAVSELLDRVEVRA